MQSSILSVKSSTYVLTWLYLNQRYETVDLPIECTTMQSGPARFFIFHCDVRVLIHQQPLQQFPLSQRSGQVQGCATKCVPQGGCIMAVWGQERPQVALGAAC